MKRIRSIRPTGTVAAADLGLVTECVADNELEQRVGEMIADRLAHVARFTPFTFSHGTGSPGGGVRGDKWSR